MRRYDGTRLLAHEPALGERLRARYGGHAVWGVHRADLQRALAARCAALGVAVRFGARAVRVVDDDDDDDDDDESQGERERRGEGEGRGKGSGPLRVHLVLYDGGTTTTIDDADVVLLADGLWSTIRPQVLGRPSPPLPTGDLAYRITLRTDGLLERDGGAEELREFLARPAVNFWIGPRAHCVGYPLRGGDLYNLVLLCPDDRRRDAVGKRGEAAAAAAAGTAEEEMEERLAGWDPLLGRLLRLGKGRGRGAVHKWRPMWLDALPEWANERGTFFMAGDCCHPVLPYLAQGPNSSLEDGAVFGSLLGRVRRSEMRRQLPCVSRLYQKLRMERGRRVQLETFKQRDDWHLEDGEAQERRDALMLSMLGKEVKAPFPSRWTCPDVQSFLYGYDAYADVEKAYQENPF